MIKSWVAVLGCVLAMGMTAVVPVSAVDKMVVHEWGTFTSLQDEKGEAIGGINTDDEPVPKFVHRLAQHILLTPTEVPPVFFQGAPRCHPHVTMRLETPVIYFHPAANEKVTEVDVRVTFHGGWLTEYFPDAQADAPGMKLGSFKFGALTGQTKSELAWNHLKVGVPGDGPATKEHVWISPRAVNAASVEASNGEKEKFLFYRGVAHLDSPLRVSRDESGKKLEFRSQLDPQLGVKSLSVAKAWLVDIQRSGAVAFRALPAMSLEPKRDVLLAKTLAGFVDADFAAENLQKLKAALRSALVAEGLFADEADALLNTWELSYFKSAGLRVFYLVPQPWTDAVMPLEFSNGVKANRIMVGRIELITPERRELLRKLGSQDSVAMEKDRQTLHELIYGQALSARSAPGDETVFNKLFDGTTSLAAQKLKAPPSYQLYLDLGRFRNALVLAQQKSQPSAGLENFIKLYRLEAY